MTRQSLLSLPARSIWMVFLLASALAPEAATVIVRPIDTLTGANWRRPNTLKANDPDGDNSYGTDGYLLFNWSGANWDWAARDTSKDKRALPSYILSVSDDFNHQYRNDNVYGPMNDPDNPAQNHPGTVASGSVWDWNTITIKRKGETAAFALTVISSYDLFDHQVWVYSGNAAEAVRGDIAPATAKARYLTFYIGAGGEDVVVRVYSQGNNLSGLAFDGFEVKKRVVLEDFTREAATWGELRYGQGGVTLSIPSVVPDEETAGNKVARVAFDTGTTTATHGITEIYTLPVTIPYNCIAFSWRAKAPAGLAYALEIEDTSGWVHHATPRQTQTIDSRWQQYRFNIAELAPPLPAELRVANIYLKVFGESEGGLRAMKGEALFDDFIFEVPDLTGTADSAAQILGLHQGLPYKSQ